MIAALQFFRFKFGLLQIEAAFLVIGLLAFAIFPKLRK